MTAFDGVLLYDGDCPFCSAASSALRRVSAVGAIPWEAEAAQAFLRAQFGDVPFALVFVDADGGRVYAGREAARELCDRAGVPVLAGDVVRDGYESAADAIRTVAGIDREPDPYHGVYPLSTAGRERFEALEAAAEHPPSRVHGLTDSEE